MGPFSPQLPYMSPQYYRPSLDESSEDTSSESSRLTCSTWQQQYDSDSAAVPASRPLCGELRVAPSSARTAEEMSRRLARTAEQSAADQVRQLYAALCAVDFKLDDGDGLDSPRSVNSPADDRFDLGAAGRAAGCCDGGAIGSGTATDLAPRDSTRQRVLFGEEMAPASPVKSRDATAPLVCPHAPQKRRIFARDGPRGGGRAAPVGGTATAEEANSPIKRQRVVPRQLDFSDALSASSGVSSGSSGVSATSGLVSASRNVAPTAA
eukprot:TRINITY_DN36095_c0_g1_i1.p2 TRINITY_DN36095_c0_g1~~TRINITY_DN36095_c0_g1_i1.p2  ORF type:complete len:266 (+),score=-22.24 TRINITY_DN36095_c0_g1_i1:143-940(+)